MVNVTDGAHVQVRFVTFEFFFSHEIKPLVKALIKLVS